MNIAMLLQMAADACPDRRALTSGHDHLTYRALFDAACAAAGLIRASGCRYVSVLDTSSPAVPIALMGAAMAGVAYVPLNYRLTREQLDALMARITPVYLVVGETHQDIYAGISRRSFLDATLAAAPSEARWEEDASAVAVQLFTSGTTGQPKAALLRHEHLVSYILGTVDFMSAEEDEATLVSVPPYHIAGISAVLSSLYACRRVVQLPDFGAALWLELAEHEGVTNAFVVPTMLSRIVDHLDTIAQKPHLGALRAIAYGGGKMPVQLIERALELFPDVAFTNAYGLTETSSTIALLDPNDHREAFGSQRSERAPAARLGRQTAAVDRARNQRRRGQRARTERSRVRSTCAVRRYRASISNATHATPRVGFRRAMRVTSTTTATVSLRSRGRRDRPRRREHLAGGNRRSADVARFGPRRGRRGDSVGGVGRSGRRGGSAAEPNTA